MQRYHACILRDREKAEGASILCREPLILEGVVLPDAEAGGARDGKPRHSKIGRISSAEWIAAKILGGGAIVNMSSPGFIRGSGRVARHAAPGAEVVIENAKHFTLLISYFGR